MLNRIIKNELKKALELKKIVILYGARQVGKKTLAKEIQQELGLNSEYFLGDYLDIQELFSHSRVRNLLPQIKNLELIILDEAQRIKDVGLTLKIIHEELPNLKILVTGSSSLELSQGLKEPLTGRSMDFLLYPLSFQEISDDQSLIKANLQLNNLLIYGSYPEVFDGKAISPKEALKNIADNYLYKDLFMLPSIENTELLRNLLKALAWQIGNQVSLNELARLLNSHPETIKKYITLLEKSFVIFSLNSFSNNLRNEIKHSRKIYFWDLGIRNYLIGNFSPIELRADKGQLWENFVIAERFKYLNNNRKFINQYFWRNYYQSEIDYLEEENGQFKTYEIKFSNKKNPKIPQAFAKSNPNSSFEVINPDNFYTFISSR